MRCWRKRERGITDSDTDRRDDGRMWTVSDVADEGACAAGASDWCGVPRMVVYLNRVAMLEQDGVVGTRPFFVKDTRSQFHFRTTDVTGAVERSEGQEMVIRETSAKPKEGYADQPDCNG